MKGAQTGPGSAAQLSVLDAIRRGHDTVNRLAADLGVTDNAVRLHLASLERDRLVVRRGTRRSGVAGQPAVEYQLTVEGEVALSRAYPAALTALVGALADRLEARTLRAVFSDAGKRLAEREGARESAHALGSLVQRAEASADLLRSLGGSATVEASRQEVIVQGAGCPLAAAVREAPSTCVLVEALIAKHAHVRAVQECDHGDAPRCRFRLESLE